MNSCPNCSGTELRRVRACDNKDSKTQLSIFECRNCVFAWQWPYADGTAVSDHNYESATGYFSSNIKQAIVALETEFVSSVKKPPGTLLDIGAGDGTFVNSASAAGWQARGIDPSPVAAARSDGSITCGFLTDLPNSPAYDVITAWDVIEHVVDPPAFLKDALTRLLPGGWLIVETGNYQSAARIESQEHWYLWGLDHKWYFSPGYLIELLRRAGFQQINFAKKTLRPNFRRLNRSRFWLTRYALKHALKHPRSASMGVQLLGAYKRWPEWVEIPIMTIAAQR